MILTGLLGYPTWAKAGCDAIKHRNATDTAATIRVTCRP